MNISARTYILILILVLAIFLRLWNISDGDPLTDEVLYAFRAIDLVDFDEAGDQTTPLEWFDPDIPAWTKLSFHDHPPFVFWIQHISMRMFGESTFGFRFPSALFGIASVYILYLIGRKLYGTDAGLFVAALFALTVNHIAISRLGIQESYVIFFFLLALYVFLRSLEDKLYLIFLGIVLGMAFLTKYTLFVLVPIFCTYILIYRREYLLSKQFWVGALISIVLFSPVLIYNYMLWKTVGHFDFQFSYIFGQNPSVWSITPGKDHFPTLMNRLVSFAPNLIEFHSWIFILIFIVSTMLLFYTLLLVHRDAVRKNIIIFIAFIWLIILILGFIGPSFRFTSLLTPVMALAIAGAFSSVTWIQTKKYFYVVVFLLLSFEILYSINSQIIPFPYGMSPWVYSNVRLENYQWGYNELDTFLSNEFDGRMPAFAFESRYQFISEIHKKELARSEREGKIPYPLLVVYDNNVQSIGQLWVLDRFQIYHAWPVIPIDRYLQFLQTQGADFFTKAGVEKTIVVIPSVSIPLKSEPYQTRTGVQFENALQKTGLKPSYIIKNAREDEAFRIYELTNNIFY